MSTETTAARSELRRVLARLRSEFTVAALCSMGANLLMLTPTIYMLQVFDRVLVSRNELTLLAVSLIALFLFLVLAGTEAWRSGVLVRITQRLDALLSGRVMSAGFDAALLPVRSDAPRPLSDLTQLRQFLTGQGALALFDVVWTPIYVAALWLLHPALGLMALGFVAVQGLLVLVGHQRGIAPAEAVARTGEAETAFLRRQLQGADALEAMGMRAALWRRYAAQHLRQLAAGARMQAHTHRVGSASKFVRYTQQSLALGLGALLVIRGDLTVGAMIASNVLMTRALAPIDALVGAWRGLVGARAAYRRLQALLQAHPAPQAGPVGRALQGHVALRGLVATAAGRAAPILPGLDLVLEPGTVTAVVGPSGSGKSTLARAIVGAWPDCSGQVLLDGRPIADWPRAELGPQLGYLPQDIALFEGSVAENIARCGEPDAARVIAAARLAGLHELILRLPQGYDTPVGDPAAPLSGGQQQRVALARAVYGAPALVVLDEPNANLDEAGEAALACLVRALRKRGATVLLVTHRPAILAEADRLLVLRDGRIERDGPPAQIVDQVRQAHSHNPTPPAALAAATPT